MSQDQPTERDHLLNNGGVDKTVDKHETPIIDGQEADDNHTMLETVVENVEWVADEIKEAFADECHAIAEEAHDVQDAFLDDLNEMDNGEAYFLDMALTRNLSILPSDLEKAAAYRAEAQEDFTKPVLPETVNGAEETQQEHIPFHAYITLALAVVALSSIGPSLAMQSGVNPTMKIFWRMSGTWMFLFPFALNSVRKEGFPRMSHTHWCTLGCAAVCYAIMCVAFVLALDFTTVGNAVIFANSQALLLLLGKLLVGAPIMLLEGGGALTAFGGAILCTIDAASSGAAAAEDSEGGGTGWSGWGDILAMTAGLGGVGYLVFAKTVRSKTSVYIFMFMNMVLASLATLVYMLLAGQKVTFGRDVHTGLFGFLNLQKDRLPLELFMVVVCNMTGSLGYIRSMQYFSNIIISVATLLEPVVASFLATMIGVGVLPGFFGWIGNVLVVVGTTFVVLPGAQKGSSSGH